MVAHPSAQISGGIRLRPLRAPTGTQTREVCAVKCCFPDNCHIPVDGERLLGRAARGKTNMVFSLYISLPLNPHTIILFHGLPAHEIIFSKVEYPSAPR